MKKFLFLTFLIFALPAQSENAILVCTGNFEHSDTTKVQVVLHSDGNEEVTEEFRDGETATHIATSNEYEECAYKISPIFGVSRVIRSIDGEWFIDYDCGESRRISCTTTERFCTRD